MVVGSNDSYVVKRQDIPHIGLLNPFGYKM
jgi:hypothetical protein